MAAYQKREVMNIVIAGHVDHGKSTIIGRMLADTNSLPEGKLEQVKENCRRNSKPFEYAFLLDALKDEQSQGITIDSARVFFSTKKREYIIIDAPGHIEFLKNMVTGASRAEAALLVIDAEEGVRENSRRHGYMLSMLGIKQVVVLVNKMDLVKYDRGVFEGVVEEYKKFLAGINLAADFVPVSGMEGDTVAKLTDKMPWYKGKTVLEVLDAFQKEPHPVDKPFRMPVQDVYKFTKGQDKRRIIAGTVQTGSIEAGDEVIFYPSGKKSTIKTVETFGDGKPNPVSAGWASAFTLDQQIYVSRGEIATKAGQELPKVTNTLRVNLFWMGKRPMIKDKDYLIKVGTAKEHVRLKEVTRVIDASELNSSQNKDRIEHHDVGECVLHVKKAIAFDLAEHIAVTGRFVIVDDFEICGGGIIRESLEDDQLQVRDYVMTRNYKWETGDIPRDDRAEKYSQKPTLILITGEKDVGKKTLARAIEARLFAEGKIIYFLGIGNILYGVDADIKTTHDSADIQKEHLRRLAEVANVMLDAGIILVVTAIGLTQDDLELITAAVDIDSVNVVWIGDKPSDISYDMLVLGNWKLDETVDSVKKMLQTKGIIFKP